MTTTSLPVIPSHFPEADCVLRFLEPRGLCPNTLWQRLFAGTYDKPFILEAQPEVPAARSRRDSKRDAPDAGITLGLLYGFVVGW
jgi:hypothetical protein